MPKAAMNKYDQAPAGKYEVGTTGKVFPVQTKSQAQGMGDPSDDHLGRRILRPNSRHQRASASRIEYVHSACLSLKYLSLGLRR